jgi:hypothetical protein
MTDEELIAVEFKFMQSGWRHETRRLPKLEVEELLDGAIVIGIDISGWLSPQKISGLTLRLKDGRKCELTEQHEMYYDCSTGWISIFVSEDWSE